MRNSTFLRILRSNLDLSKVGAACGSTGGAGGGDGPANLNEEKPKKQVTVSKQLVSKLQGCSQKIAEILSWTAKLDASGL